MHELWSPIYKNIENIMKQATLFQEERIVNESHPIHTVDTPRKHIGWPCDEAQNLPIDDRPAHIKNCEECKRLLEKLEKSIGIRR